MTAAQPLTTNRTLGVALNPAALAVAGRVALLLAVPPAAWLARQPLAALVDLIKDREALAQMAHSPGPWGPLALMLTIGLQVTFAVLPGHVLMLAGGYL